MKANAKRWQKLVQQKRKSLFGPHKENKATKYDCEMVKLLNDWFIAFEDWTPTTNEDDPNGGP